MIFHWLYKWCVVIGWIVSFFAGEMMARESLTIYRARRDTKKSGEPSGGKKSKKNKPIFVIQKHAASHLHYDFRIEIDGVLVSWAVPKGPSLNPGIKRLALPTDNHPMDYATFEGVIPEGNYGAGQVIVWDNGTYENIKKIDGKTLSMKQCLKRGTIEIILHGKKMRGAFALVRTHITEKESWLLIKIKDNYANARKNMVASDPQSVLSGKTIEDLKDEQDDPEVKIGKYTVNITHPNKTVGSRPRVRKQELIDYYCAIAPTMLPYLKNRPLTMQRFVDGIDKEGFFQKEIGAYFPQYIEGVTVKKEDGVVHHAVVNNAASLVYLANQLVVTFHVWLSKTNNLNKPDHMIFDLDPSGKDFSLVRYAALQLKELLEMLGLTPFVMTTGSRGLHVLVPIKPQETFDYVHSFTHDIAYCMVNKNPDILTLEMRKEKRANKVFVDYLRNGFGATGVAPYSARPRPGFPVATPLEWREVAKKTLKPDGWTIKTIKKRLAAKGDIWHGISRYSKSLYAARKKLDMWMKKER